MKVLKAKFKSNHIMIELSKNPQQKVLVKDGKVIMNSLELFEGDTIAFATSNGTVVLLGVEYDA